MSLFFDQVRTHAKVQILRHLRSPAIWWLAIATPIGARYLVPEVDASYSVMAVNNAKPMLDSGVIGLQLGIVMAIMLTPLAYIFLRAGPTRRQPWQAEDVTAARRSALGLGHWLADTAALWILMLALALAGVILAYFRLPAADVQPLVIVFALCVIAAPALTVIAALRTAFSMRPMLRKAGGDVLFFFIWLTMITVSAAFFATGATSPLIDVLGMAAPISGAADVPVEFFAIGAAPNLTEFIALDAMAGVSDPGFLFSRVFWIGVAMFLVGLSGLVFKPRKLGFPTPQPNRGAAVFSNQPVQTVKAKKASILPILMSEWSQILRPIWFAAALVAVAVVGVFLPFRGMVGAALALLLIFPLTGHGARWRATEMARLTNLAPVSGVSQLALRLVASVSLALALCLPALMSMGLKGSFSQLADVAAIGIGLPALAIGLGHLTRGPVAGRLVLLILWYGYLNLGGPPIV